MSKIPRTPIFIFALVITTLCGCTSNNQKMCNYLNKENKIALEKIGEFTRDKPSVSGNAQMMLDYTPLRVISEPHPFSLGALLMQERRIGVGFQFLLDNECESLNSINLRPCYDDIKPRLLFIVKQSEIDRSYFRNKDLKPDILSLKENTNISPELTEQEILSASEIESYFRSLDEDYVYGILNWEEIPYHITSRVIRHHASGGTIYEEIVWDQNRNIIGTVREFKPPGERGGVCEYRSGVSVLEYLNGNF